MPKIIKDGEVYTQTCKLLVENGFDGISCFLRNDGVLVDIDGTEGITIPGLAEASL